MEIIINQPRASYFVGGGELISFDHAANMVKLGNHVSFFTIKPQSVGLSYSKQYKTFFEQYNGNIKFVELDQDSKARDIYSVTPGEDRCRWNIESIFYNKVLTERLIRDGKIYDAMLSYYNLDAVYTPNKFILKNVLYLCGTPKYRDDFQGSFLSVYDRVIAITEEVKQYWQIYRKDNINVVSTGVNCERFVPLDEKVNTKTNLIKLLYVGRLISRKNVDKIIYAVKELSKTIPVLLTIVGDGPERNNLEELAGDLRIEFKGVVSEVEEYYKSADIFVTPSAFGEGVQGTVLEAMSSGLIIVATDTAANRVLLKDGRGVLIEPTEDGVVRGVKEALTLDRQKLANDVRKYIVDNYNWLEKTRQIQEEIEK